MEPVYEAQIFSWETKIQKQGPFFICDVIASLGDFSIGFSLVLQRIREAWK